jgi:hypothetical protein
VLGLTVSELETMLTQSERIANREAEARRQQ